MSTTYKLDGALFAQMLKSGAVNLRNNAVTVNELNVFPIPDGDTGENMARTIEGGVAAIGADCKTVSDVCNKLVGGMLLSARGNSGVILSQFFEGLKNGFSGVDVAGVAELKTAFRAGVKQAYSAVVEPTEGTILTVMREAADKADGVGDDASVEAYFDAYADELYASLERTPELLPVLKESGVIDSGGAGFVYIIEGMIGALGGNAHTVSVQRGGEVAAADDTSAFDEDSEMPYGYCAELIVQLMRSKTDVDGYDIKTLISYLEEMGGDSVVAFKTGTRVKLHVHTFEPNKVIEYCLKVGELIAVKVENMSVQHTEAVVRNRFERKRVKPKSKYATVVVADGAGLIEQFRSLGADYVVDGKQTMNPSTQDFLSAFDAVNAEVIFVLPNNSNVILAAKQAAELYDKARIIVIESKTLAEGYSAMSMHDFSSDDVDRIIPTFTDAMHGVTTGLVSYSIRDCKMGGKTIKKNDFIGFADKTLISCADTVHAAACKLLDGIDLTDKSVITCMCGKEHATQETLAAVQSHVAEHYPDIEFYAFDGGQDVYPFIFVIE